MVEYPNLMRLVNSLNLSPRPRQAALSLPEGTSAATPCPVSGVCTITPATGSRLDRIAREAAAGGQETVYRAPALEKSSI
jgi:hypothetical protein